MDGFSYTDIFDTKGIEYIVVITFLLLVIPFWRALNKPVKVREKVSEGFGILTDKLLNIPMGLLYSKNHTWAHMEQSGNARVGVDDLLLHLTGEVELVNLINPGERVQKGDPIAEIKQGERELRIASPVSGEIQSVNTLLEKEPGVINRQLRGKDWICKIKPEKWFDETKNYIMGEEARSWSKHELEKFKDFISGWLVRQSPDASHVILQAGGELTDGPLSEMPGIVWKDFQEKFLNYPD